MAERIGPGETFTRGFFSRETDMRVGMTAKVISYDAGARTCRVQPNVNKVLPDGNGGYVFEPFPELANVRVAHVRGGGFFASVPLAKGDTVWLAFSDYNMTAWRSTGQQSDPGDIRLHHIGGAVAFPVDVAPDGDDVDAHAQNMVVGRKGGAQIHITPGDEILVGSSSAAHAVAMADAVATAMQAVVNAIAGVTSSPSEPVAAAIILAMHTLTLPLANWPGTIGSAKIKVVP